MDVIDLLFERDAWQRWCDYAKKQELMPWIVGTDLRSLKRGFSLRWFLRGFKKPGRCVMVIQAVDAIPVEEAKSLFFEALKKPYNYNREKDEVFFPNLNLTLNVQALEDEEGLEVDRLTELFKEVKGGLMTTAVSCRKHPQLIDLGPEKIGGNCENHPRSKYDIAEVCTLWLRDATGQSYWNSLSSPNCGRFELRSQIYGNIKFYVS